MGPLGLVQSSQSCEGASEWKEVALSAQLREPSAERFRWMEARPGIAAT